MVGLDRRNRLTGPAGAYMHALARCDGIFAHKPTACAFSDVSALQLRSTVAGSDGSMTARVTESAPPWRGSKAITRWRYSGRGR